MARFRLKPVVVEAEPYRPGLEDACLDHTGPFLDTPAGRVAVSPGDWIVTRPTGEREVVRPRDFEAWYERSLDPGPPEAAQRVRRGLPLRSG